MGNWTSLLTFSGFVLDEKIHRKKNHSFGICKPMLCMKSIANFEAIKLEIVQSINSEIVGRNTF